MIDGTDGDDGDDDRKDLLVDVYNTYDYDLLLNSNIVNSISNDQSATKIIDTRMADIPSMNKTMLLLSPRTTTHHSIQSAVSSRNRMKKTMDVNAIKQMEYEYNRPDLAPFSTMINQKMENSLLYKYRRIGVNAVDMNDWDQFASISDTYSDELKASKSSAFKVLEKLSGITKEQVESAKLIVHESSKVRAVRKNSFLFL